ncbi:vWA domain-containing protein [Bacillus horti]|uniref:Ca-activated chloride channel family protein n=1 Tax=Caldalkalibacillus horti TaxID=77523 RepID=A0ABT9W412_9BACI|nr:VWA domain-containing protein [Bacillus horti]MDQ0167595.1 Ca-activated chloride channel family protein [Bacillus horti]
MNKGRLKQILLLTDGCSNVGGDPIAVASMAGEYGVTINVIGIVDEDSLGEKGKAEVRDIALAGQGVYQFVRSKQLPKTVQMVTRKAMNQTLHHVVNKELRHILGDKEQVEALPPEQRGKVVEVVEDLGETMHLDVLVLVDASASMTNKLPSIKQALRDLSLSMQSRVGDSRFAVWTFPGQPQAVEKKMEWSSQVDSLERIFSTITPRGTTPTGPALEEALKEFAHQERPHKEEGMLSDYVF